MSNAPSDRQLAKTVRNLATSQFAVRSERVMFLGPHGEVQDVYIPTKGDTDLLLARRAELLQNRGLTAVAYLGVVDKSLNAVISLVEVYETKDKRTVHMLTSVSQSGVWMEVPPSHVDNLLDKWREEATEEPAE